MYPRSQEYPEVSAEQRASNDLIKRIRKLRWIGMEDEACEAQRSLRTISSSSSRDLVLAGPCDTD
jgi:hypothetical protein